MLEALFGVFKGGGFLDKIDMSENSDDFWKPMGLKNVEKFKSFLDSKLAKYWQVKEATYHFKSKTTIDHQKHQINHFTQVDHAVKIISTFDKSDSPRLARNNSHRTLRLGEVVLRELSNKRSQQSSLSHTRRANNADNDGRRRQGTFVHSFAFFISDLAFLRVAVNQGYMETLLVLLRSTPGCSIGCSEGGVCECLRTVSEG